MSPLLGGFKSCVFFRQRFAALLFLRARVFPSGGRRPALSSFISFSFPVWPSFSSFFFRPVCSSWSPSSPHFAFTTRRPSSRQPAVDSYVFLRQLGVSPSPASPSFRFFSPIPFAGSPCSTPFPNCPIRMSDLALLIGRTPVDPYTVHLPLQSWASNDRHEQ